jgi:glucosamine--fructose-6-phosphate aminotransferase (isomerizing)
LKQTPDDVKALAKDLKDKQSMIITGKGLGEVIAKEGALKIKECTYIHAEGFPSGEFKHGPLALVGDDKELPII